MIRIQHTHYHYPDDEAADRLRRVEHYIGLILKALEKQVIDTSKIIDAVAAAKTKVDSLIALASGQSAAMKELSAKLADAISANDPAAMAAVQSALDKAADDLNAETAAVSAAIDANTAPANP